MDKIFGFMVGLVVFVGLLFLVSLLLAWPVMALWNWVAIVAFNAKALTFWQSWGLLLLTGLLFRSGGKSS